MQEAEAVFDEVKESPVMEKLWQSYQKNYSYAADLSWHTVMDSVRRASDRLCLENGLSVVIL